MLRNQQPRIVVTFHTTMAAMQTEHTAQMYQMAGRLIPLPREISAGCGLAWSAPPQTEKALREMLIAQNISFEDIYHLTI